MKYLKFYYLCTILILSGVNERVSGQCLTIPDTTYCVNEANETISTLGTTFYACQSNYLTLTTAVPNAIGGARYFEPDTFLLNRTYDLTEGFTIHMLAHFDTIDAGGEGFVLVLFKNLEDFNVCRSGGYLGYQNIPNSLGFEFDTNPQVEGYFGDITTEDHFSLLQNSVGNALFPAIGMLPAWLDSTSRNVERIFRDRDGDTTGLEIVLKYDPDETLLECEINGYTRMVYEIDLATYFGSSEVLPGITSSTGDIPSEQKLTSQIGDQGDPRIINGCTSASELDNWILALHPDANHWVRGGLRKRQVIRNGLPSFWLSPISFIDARMECIIEVPFGTPDNDYFGISWGHQYPFAQYHDTFDTYLLDWKQVTQDSFHFNSCSETLLTRPLEAPMGITLAYANGRVHADCGEPAHANLITHEDADHFQVRAWERDIAWEAGQRYRFRVDYFSNYQEVWIFRLDSPTDSTQVFYHRSTEGPFQPGRFGFYNFSQKNTRYSDFSYQWLPNFTVSHNTICRGDTIRFDYAIPNSLLPSVVDSVRWDFGNGHTQSAIENGAFIPVDYTYPQAGTFSARMVIYDPSGCPQYSDRYPIVVLPAPRIDLGPDTTLCPGQVLYLESGANSGIIWNGSIVDPTYIADRPGLITATVSNSFCGSGDTIQISYADTLTYRTQITNSCAEQQNGQVQVQVTSNSAPYQVYLDSVFGTDFRNLPPGTHSLHIVDTYGCTANSDLEIMEACYPDYEMTIDSVSCHDAADGRLEVLSEACPLVFLLNGATISGSGVFTELPAGDYQLIVVDTLGCEWPKSITVPAPPPLTLAVTADTLIYYGECLPLWVEPSFGYPDSVAWHPTRYLTSSDSNIVLAQPDRTTIFEVALINDRGCFATASMEVKVQRRDSLYIPNAFSPNGDGKNELFYPMAGRLAKSVRQIDCFQIFDRRGSLVFERQNFQPDDRDFAWDGTFKGRPAATQVYVYRLTWEQRDGIKQEQSGNVHLIR